MTCSTINCKYRIIFKERAYIFSHPMIKEKKKGLKYAKIERVKELYKICNSFY